MMSDTQSHFWQRLCRRSKSEEDMSPDLVTQYLLQHPDFLEQYVDNYVNVEEVEKWLQHKTHHSSRLSSHHLNQHQQHPVNGEVLSEGRLPSSSSLSKWKSRIQSSKGRVLQELAKEITHPNHARLAVLLELAACVATAISADGHNFYSVDEKKGEICHLSTDSSGQIAEGQTRPIGGHSTVASYVSLTKEAVRVPDMETDQRFSRGLGCGSSKRNCAVLGLPVTDANSVLLGVVEFCRYTRLHYFTVEEEEVATYMLLWADLFVAYMEMHSSLTRQRKLNEFLLAVTKSIFQDIVSMDTVIMKIMSFARKLVSADRASIFLLDHKARELYARIFDNFAKTLVSADRASLFLTDAKSQELFARIFDTGVGDETCVPYEIRFPMDKGVAGHVASTGEILNIPDAYADDRFNRDVDLQTGYHTKTILCMPIYIRGHVIGVVQMVNKLSGTFNRHDEESFETFAIYCGLALHHAKLYDKIRRSEQKYRVALEVLSYHSQANEEELNSLRALPMPEYIPSITDYKFSPWDVEGDRKPLFVLFMFRDLFSQMRYDMEDLMRFTLTVRRNYRNVPYHNWVHAFSVAHSMYTVIKTSCHRMTDLECLALFVACLCHDLDHRGKTNSFMVKSASPLAAVYSTSTMEHHHFNQTVTILQHEGHNIFKYLSSEEYKQVLSEIRFSILATDLALFFTNHARLKDVLSKTQFTWDLPEHKELIMGISMTACDLCAMFKPWKTQLDLVYVIMEEFWQQGDEEKEKGMTPMAMMDRDKQNELPQLEVGFILGICLPCYKLMTDVLPETGPMLSGVTENLKKWQQLAQEQEDIAERALSRQNSKDQQQQDSIHRPHNSFNNNNSDRHPATDTSPSEDRSTARDSTNNKAEDDVHIVPKHRTGDRVNVDANADKVRGVNHTMSDSASGAKGSVEQGEKTAQVGGADNRSVSSRPMSDRLEAVIEKGTERKYGEKPASTLDDGPPSDQS